MSSLHRNSYGKAEIHVVHVDHRQEQHEVHDLTVYVKLEGEFASSYLTGDNSMVVATDSQKNVVFGVARTAGNLPPEVFGLRIADEFLERYPQIEKVRVGIRRDPWQHLDLDGKPAAHAFARVGTLRQTARVVIDRMDRHVLGGLDGLSLLKSAGSEFRGFVRDQWTTLPETADRILASRVAAAWRLADAGSASDAVRVRDRVTRALYEAFASTHSLSLQQTLYAMGDAALAVCPELAEIRLTMPNLHHFLVDLAPFALDNPLVVFHADDRPYGVIEGALLRDGAQPAPDAWEGDCL